MSETRFMEILDEGVYKAFTDLGEITRKSARDILLEHVWMLGRYLAESTAPFTQTNRPPEGKENPEALRRFDGGSDAARIAGQSAVARDIGRVYKSSHLARDQMKKRGPEGEAMAKAFGGMIRKRDIAGAQELLRRSGIPMRGLNLAMFDGGEKHKRMKSNRGRINAGTAPTLVIDYGKIDPYKKKIMNHVGYTKSGWTTAARQITTIGAGQVNGWIKNKPGPGIGKDNTSNRADMHVTLTNNVPWIQKAMPESFMANATESFERSVKEKLENVVRYHIDKYNL